MKILVVSPKNKTVFNFRGDLIKNMIAGGNEVYVTGPNTEYKEDIMSLGVTEFFEVPLVKDNTSVSGDLKYLKKLRTVMREIKPDMVFSYNIKPVVYGSIAARLEHVPHIFAMVAGLGRIYSSKSLKSRILKIITFILYKKAFKACDKVIFQNSDDIEELVKNKYLPREKTVRVNGSGVNMERFTRNDLPEETVFLMVGRIIRDKGVIEYCEASRAVKKEYPDVRCILLGGFDKSIGSLKVEDIQQYIDDGSIELPGEVKDPVSYYHKASVFVLPSYYREGLPRTILEAMSCGRPIITTDWIGCRDPIVDGKNGFLVPIRNSDALADKMKKFASDRELAVSMGAESYSICKNDYDVNVVNSKMKEIMCY